MYGDSWWWTLPEIFPDHKLILMEISWEVVVTTL